MANNENKLHARDRFMPCLISRLTDDNPHVKSETFSRGVTIKQLKQDILWNIELILNSRSHPKREDLGSDLVANSVLGLGLSDFCGRSHGATIQDNIKNELLHQLKCFEPRLDHKFTTIDTVNVDSHNGSVIMMEIHSRINVKPLLEEELMIHSKLDLESGVATLTLAEER